MAKKDEAKEEPEVEARAQAPAPRLPNVTGAELIARMTEEQRAQIEAQIDSEAQERALHLANERNRVREQRGAGAGAVATKPVPATGRSNSYGMQR